MADIARSLEVIEAEINFYKQQTASGIVEIGKRLIEAKGQLQHGKWGKWLEDKVDFSQMTANRFMRAATEFSNSTALLNLSQTKVFALLDIPSDERQEFVDKPHKVGEEIKTVDEMTTRELQEAIKERKAAEQKAEEALKQAETAQMAWQAEREERNRLEKELSEKHDPEIIERVVRVEVIPEDYEHLKKEKQSLLEQNKTLLEQKQQIARQLQESKELHTQIINIEEFRQNIGYFLEKMAKYTFYSEAFAILEKRHQTEFLKQVEKIEIWCTEVKQAIRGQESEKTIIFEGGFISE